MRTRVKICGITRVEDARLAVAAGADAIGLVFHAASPRHLAIDRAQAIARAVPAFVTVVGVLVDPDPARVREILATVGLDLLQFHGAEPAEFCRAFGRPYIKAVCMRAGVDLHAIDTAYPDARALLLDSFDPAAAGGTGRTFGWERIPRDLRLPLILAGGLTDANVAQAIAALHPHAVDVSSGVERAPGIKDADKIAEFMRRVSETR